MGSMFSGYHIITKIALNDGVNAVVFSFYRDVITSVLLLMVTSFMDGAPRIEKQWIPRLMFLGLFGVAGNQVFFILGLQYTNATNAAIMQPVIPVWAVILAVLFGFENIYVKKWFGISRIVGVGLATAGSVIMIGVSGSSSSSSSDLLVGNLFLLANTLSMAIYTTFIKFVLARYFYISTIYLF